MAVTLHDLDEILEYFLFVELTRLQILAKDIASSATIIYTELMRQET